MENDPVKGVNIVERSEMPGELEDQRFCKLGFQHSQDQTIGNLDKT